VKSAYAYLSIAAVCLLSVVIGGFISYYGADPGANFQPFLGYQIGLTGAHGHADGSQTVRFTTGTVFPIRADDDPAGQNVYKHAVVSFAGSRTPATLLTTVALDNRTYDTGPVIVDGRQKPDVSSVILGYWEVKLPVMAHLARARYLFIVTACRADGQCQSGTTTVCVQGDQIIGRPRQAGQTSTCDDPEWDTYDADYDLRRRTSRSPYRFPSNWSDPIAPFDQTSDKG